jgi:hypothetical protein
MMESARLYGFGSFFSDQVSAPRDVDILVLHERVDSSSIEFAISCKSVLKLLMFNAHIVMLSESEERELAFVQRCGAIFLGRVTNTDPGKQLVAICRSISGARSCDEGEDDRCANGTHAGG